MSDMLENFAPKSLAGLRLGLSGAVPDSSDWDGRPMDWEMLNFVANLSDSVFRYGGHLVHGCHPSFTPVILAQAEVYAAIRSEPFVTLVMSSLWSNGDLAKTIRGERYRKIAKIIEVEKVTPADALKDVDSDEKTRNASLSAMRKLLIAEMNAIVIIGGKKWLGTEKKPGTVEELEIALERHLPCFLVGGFGGMAGTLAKQYSKSFQALNNGLTQELNNCLGETENLSLAIGIILDRFLNRSDWREKSK